jgi:hypothetical protein
MSAQGRLAGCSLATLTRGSCLAVDRQDRLKASPLIPAVGSAALRFPSDGTVAPPPLPIWAWRPRSQASSAAHRMTQQDHPARDAAHPACSL